MIQRVGNLILWTLACLIVVGTATVEDWYGRTFYADDAIGYFDVSRAINHGDWVTALNPYWSIGYPLLLSAAHWIFPPSAFDEWTALHVINLILFVLIYLCFLYFLKAATIFTATANGAIAGPRAGWNFYIVAIGTTIFLLWQILIGNVSRLSPDPMISGIFLLVQGVALRLIMRPATGTALLLGFLLGLGYVIKAVFLPISVAFLLILLLHGLTRPAGARLRSLGYLAWALPAMALLTLPYATALSLAVGKFTFGESGRLNYDWNVNYLPREIGWIGGPEPFGRPIHPEHMVGMNPPVYTFAEPFHVTYPPWYNPPYWYEGYRHVFILKNQIALFQHNLRLLADFFFGGPHGKINAAFWGIVLAVFFLLLKERRAWLQRLIMLWPLYLPPLAGLLIYLVVTIELRYVAGSLIALLVIPFLPLFVPTPLISKTASAFLLWFLILVSVLYLGADKFDVFLRACHNEPYALDPAWQTGLYLKRLGAQPGDKVASVKAEGNIDCTWAYVGQVFTVAEIGNNAYDKPNQLEDIRLFTDDLTVQQSVFNLFTQAGAVFVVARGLDTPPQGPGWVNVPGTNSWIHRLPATVQ